MELEVICSPVLMHLESFPLPVAAILSTPSPFFQDDASSMHLGDSQEHSRLSLPSRYFSRPCLPHSPWAKLYRRVNSSHPFCFQSPLHFLLSLHFSQLAFHLPLLLETGHQPKRSSFVSSRRANQPFRDETYLFFFPPLPPSPSLLSCESFRSCHSWSRLFKEAACNLSLILVQFFPKPSFPPPLMRFIRFPHS